jgi:hypothetical protein
VIALILGGLIAVAAVVIVALPFLRDSDEPELLDSGRETEELLNLMEARDRSLAALKELEFDHTTGKIDDVDYRALVGPLRRQAAAALQALDAKTAMNAKPASKDLGEQKDVQTDDQGGNRRRNSRRRAAVDQAAHQLAAGGEPNQRDERERDPEAQDDL